MKYRGDSTVEKLERGYACKTRGHVAVRMCDPVREVTLQEAKSRRGMQKHTYVR